MTSYDYFANLAREPETGVFMRPVVVYFNVNCAGLGAIEFANEDMYPLRGAWIRVRNDGKTIPQITSFVMGDRLYPYANLWYIHLLFIYQTTIRGCHRPKHFLPSS